MVTHLPSATPDALLDITMKRSGLMNLLRGLAAVSLLLTLVACSSEDPDNPATDPAASSPASSSSGSPTPTPSPDSPSSPATTSTPSPPAGPQLLVTIEGERVGPNSQEIDLAVGETLVIRFDTDRGGQLHVHSTPEQYVEFEPGTSTKELVIKAPGVVEVEEHDTSHVVASIEVR